VARTAIDMSAWTPESALETTPIVTLENGQSGLQKFSFWHHDDIDAGVDAVVAKELSDQPFGPIPLHGTANLPGCCNSEPCKTHGVGQNEHRAVATSDTQSVLVYAQEFWPAPDPALARLGPHPFAPVGRRTRGGPIRC
jgi:hypothetical protein